MNLAHAINQASNEISEWNGFQRGDWSEGVDVRDFIIKNYTVYEGDASFLSGPTQRTKAIWAQVLDLMKQENAKDGPLDFDPDTPSSITSHRPGYIDKSKEIIVGLQTDAPLKRAIMPMGGLKMVQRSCEVYGKKLNPVVEEIFTKYRKTHNQGVFDTYTQDIFACRKAGIITGLPDAYGRGRIVGDYRRVALYGIDWLIAAKIKEKAGLNPDEIDSPKIRLLEELTEQINALASMKEMAAEYGFDISRPAANAREAIQWTYFGYLASVKSQNGAAMSLGRVSTFFDVYIQRDIERGVLTEEQAQELIDDLVIKLRMIRFLRTPEYDQLFSGDPAWVTESIAGMGEDGRPLVTKGSFRILQTLYNLGPSPEPNLTVFWSSQLPAKFKEFCAKVSIDTSSIQYESDDLMRPYWGDDYCIACCVSAMRTGKQMQFFGARCNLAKGLLFSINGGRDEVSGVQVAPEMAVMDDEVLDYDKVMERFDYYIGWVAKTYIKALNIIHYMHDRYCYESALMALHDRDILRTMACGIAGLSIVADSLSAIKYAKVRPIKNDEGIVVDYETTGDFPKYGNNDPRVDDIASSVVTQFMDHLRRHPTYRHSVPTQSVLTITSNVVYGKKTGATPDGRKAGEPFAPGANPMHGRDEKGALASLLSVAKLPYKDAQDGISNTLSIVPKALGKNDQIKINNLTSLLDGYFKAEGQHLNVNVLNRDMLLDAMENPEQYPQLTIRVSGYAVNFVKLTREQQLDVISRTFHDNM
ncbi:MAG: formate acetyltransferase [Gammaproteobacteria bacterium]|nr:MAG: formate acetyltransferase [Gammaproteobacteria bacterium]